MQFTDTDLLTSLTGASADVFDALEFGAVAMDATGIVTGYNRVESELSGLSAAKVLGQNFFFAIAPCTNNFLVAQRYLDEPTLDAFVDYVFTLKMRPTKVRLRLLQSPGTQHKYLLVVRR